MKQGLIVPPGIHPDSPQISTGKNKKKKPKKTLVYVMRKTAGVMTIYTTLPKIS